MCIRAFFTLNHFQILNILLISFAGYDSVSFMARICMYQTGSLVNRKLYLM